MITDSEQREIAESLLTAYERGESVSLSSTTISVSEGYEIQRKFVSARTDTEGPIVGYKLGFTNKQVQDEIGVQEPVYGYLLAETVNIDAIKMAELVDPRIEPEIVVRLDEPLPPSASRSEVASAIASVAPAIEIVDTRTGTWSPTPGIAVADNALASRLAVGPERSFSKTESLANIGVTVCSDEIERTGYGKAVLGDPLQAVVWLAGNCGESLAAGTVISTGSLTKTLPLVSGKPVTTSFSSLDGITVPAE